MLQKDAPFPSSPAPSPPAPVKPPVAPPSPPAPSDARAEFYRRRFGLA